MNLQEQINQLKESIKKNIRAYGQNKFAKDYSMDKGDVSKFMNSNREWSAKKLMAVDNFFQKK